MWEFQLFLAHFERQREQQKQADLLAKAKQGITSPRLRAI